MNAAVGQEWEAREVGEAMVEDTVAWTAAPALTDEAVEELLDAFAQRAAQEPESLDDWSQLVSQGYRLMTRLRTHLAKNQFLNGDVVQRAFFQTHALTEGLQILLARAEEFADEYAAMVDKRENRIVLLLTGKDEGLVRAVCHEDGETVDDFVRRYYQPQHRDGQPLPKSTQDVAKRLADVKSEGAAARLRQMRRFAHELDRALKQCDRVHYSVKSLADPMRPRDLWHGA